MHFTTLAVALLAHIACLTSAAPMQTNENARVEDAALLPRALACSNYPSNVPGTFFKKRDDVSSLEDRDVESASLAPRAGQVNWCRTGSNEWIYFPSPGGNVATQTEYGNLFKMGLQVTQDQINAGNGNEYVSTAVSLGCVNGYNHCFTANPTNLNWTWAQIHVAVQILQNYVYVTKHYASIGAMVMAGQTKLGTLLIN